MDLVYGASKIHKITRCNTEIGHPGTLSYRIQANSTTDNPETIILGVMEGISFGSGDACIGINPVEDNFESTNRIAQKVFEFVKKYDVPTQITVLSHITTQMDAMRRGTPLSMIFQSIAGTEKTNDSFGVTKNSYRKPIRWPLSLASVLGRTFYTLKPGRDPKCLWMLMKALMR